MKRELLLMTACVFSLFSFSQLKVTSEGYANSSNFNMDGVVGSPDGTGVLTVTSRRVHEKYNSFVSPLPGLIRTKDAMSGVLPFSHMQNNTLRFYVKNNGNVYATALLLPQASASAAQSRSVSGVSAFTFTSTLSKLQSLHGVVYQENQPVTEPVESLRAASEPDDSAPVLARGMSLEEIAARMEEEKSRNRIGLLAAEVEQVLPDVVRTLPDGNKGILYSDLVAVLVEGMKELQDSLASQGAQLKELREMVSSQKSSYAPSWGDKQTALESALGVNEACLYANTPNPFNRETEIAYRLSKDAGSAFICIYNLNGQQLKKYPVSTASLTGKLMVSASEFQPGMYIYALIIDNEMIDSKRMTLTD